MNRVQLIGNLGADPEAVNVAGGAQLVKLRLATTERGFITKDGQQIPERTTWHDISTWGALAVACKQMLQKGSKVYVEGIMHSRTVEKDGQRTIYWQVDATSVEFLAGLRPKQPAQPTQPQYATPPTMQDYAAAYPFPPQSPQQPAMI